MSAREVIQSIKELPAIEQLEVKQFAATLDPKPVRFADYETAMKIGREIMDQNEELFRKLAQ